MVRESILEALAAVHRALDESGLPHALIEGAAMPFHGHDRSTRDVDLIVLATEDRGAAIEKVVHRLRNEGFAHQDRVDRRRIEDGTLVMAWYPLRPRPISLRVDLFLVGEGFRAEVVARALPRCVDGFEIPVATLEDLVLLKCLAGRPADRSGRRPDAHRPGRKSDRRLASRSPSR